VGVRGELTGEITEITAGEITGEITEITEESPIIPPRVLRGGVRSQWLVRYVGDAGKGGGAEDDEDDGEDGELKLRWKEGTGGSGEEGMRRGVEEITTAGRDELTMEGVEAEASVALALAMAKSRRAALCGCGSSTFTTNGRCIGLGAGKD
jgi:hypothetical protein